MNTVLNTPELRVGILSHIPPRFNGTNFGSCLLNSALVSKAWNTDAKIAKQMWVEREFVPFTTYGGLTTADDLRKFISERKFIHVNLSQVHLALEPSNIRINYRVMCEVLKVCGNLQSLDLSMTNLTDPMVGEIFNNAPNLTSLTLNYCWISKGGFVDIPENHQLQALNLRRCLNIKDSSVDRIFKTFLQLRALNLDFTRITDEVFDAIPENNLLQFLSIRNNSKISDAGISRLVAKCALKLQSLNISEVFNVTKEGITSILNGCVRLESLHVTQAQSKRVDLILAKEKNIEIVIEQCTTEGDSYFHSEESADGCIYVIDSNEEVSDES